MDRIPKIIPFLNCPILELQAQQSNLKLRAPQFKPNRVKYPTVRYFLSLFLTLLVLSCGGGGGGGGEPTGILTPTGLSAVYYAPALRITLAWTPPSATVTGYNLEAAIGNQSFQQIKTVQIDAHAKGVVLYLSPAPPEAITIQLRLQGVNGTSQSDWSNVASINTPIFAPDAGESVFVPATRSVTVSWHVVSSAALQVRLERAQADRNEAIIGPWATLTTQSAQNQTFMDTTVQENKYYAYRVTNIDGSLLSDACFISNPMAIPLFLPTNLTGVTVPQGIQLNWQNFSAVATNIIVLRGGPRQTPSIELATLGPDTQSYIDSTASFGYYSYALKITDGTNVGTSSSVMSAAPNPLGALSLQTTTVAPGPESVIGADMRTDGTWALADRTGNFEIKAAQGLWPQWLPTTWLSYGPDTIKVNGQGWPWLLYFRSDPLLPGIGVLDKVAFDGAAWVETKLVGSLSTAYTYLAPPECAWRLDPSGAIHAVITTYDLSTDYKVPVATYLYASASGVELKPLHTVPTLTSSNLFVDGGNQPHLILYMQPDHALYEWWPDEVHGTWNKTTILSGSDLIGTVRVTAQAIGVDSAWVIAANSAPAPPYTATIMGIQKVGGAWLPPKTLYSMPPPSSPNCNGMAHSLDGSRTAILILDQGVGLIVLNKSGETWMPTLVGPPQIGGLGIAFDASNRLHILAGALNSSRLVDYHE